MAETKRNKIYYENKARLLFRTGYNCAQSVLLAFADECGLDQETAAKLGQPLGAGISRMREVCGAATGMAMATGLLFGSADPEDKEGKAAVYARTQELLNQFKKDNGSIVCRELLQGVNTTPGAKPEDRSPEYYRKRPCVELVAYAAGLLAEMKEKA